MKIEIEIPNYIPPQRVIYIMAGMHKIGYIEPNTRKVFVKIVGCSQCGLCCKALDCSEMVKESGDNNLWRCGKEGYRPFICCVTEPNNIPECTVRYEEVH